MKKSLWLTILLASTVFAQNHQVIVPVNAAKPVGPYSPGILTSDYLYVSGQGIRDSKNNVPVGVEAQAKQCLENVKAIIEAAGLTMQHVVHMQLYLENLNDFAAVDQVYATYFPNQFPSRVLLGVTKMPTDTTIEMTAVVVRDLNQKKILNLKSLKPLGNASSAVQVGSRIYLSGIYGNTSGEVEANLKKALSEVKLKTANVVWRNDYGTSIAVRELPNQAKLAASIIASSQAIPKVKNNICRIEGQTIYCTAQSGNESGAKSVEEQVKIVMQKLAAGLAAFGSNFSAVTASNVYLDDIKEFKLMNDTYATFFTNAPPTRTTVQPFPTARQALVKISVVAVKE